MTDQVETDTEKPAGAVPNILDDRRAPTLFGVAALVASSLAVFFHLNGSPSLAAFTATLTVLNALGLVAWWSV